MVWRRLQAERARGRAYQPRFEHHDVLASWLGSLLAITGLGLISTWSHYPLVVAPFGASTVLLFGHPRSPLAQPRNIVLGNTIAALVSVTCVAWLGHAPWVMGLAVGVTIALG
jgi:CBS-domain-containing membrane protein